MAAVFHPAILLLLPAIVLGYATGPQNDACRDATPKHIISDNTYHEPQQQGCPYLVYFEEGYTPGETHQLTITSWSGEAEFKGYMLLVLDENSQSVGEFSSDHRTICSGAAVTHSNSDTKLQEEVHWTAPSNSSGQTYHIWLTIVRSYSQFWVNCDPVQLPAKDLEINGTTTPLELATDSNGDPIGFTWPPSLPPEPTPKPDSYMEAENTTAAATEIPITTSPTTKLDKQNGTTAKLPSASSVDKSDNKQKGGNFIMNRPRNSKSVMENSATKSTSNITRSIISLLILYFLY